MSQTFSRLSALLDELQQTLHAIKDAMAQGRSGQADLDRYDELAAQVNRLLKENEDALAHARKEISAFIEAQRTFSGFIKGKNRAADGFIAMSGSVRQLRSCLER